jgi:hypothetical protein
MTCWRYSSRQHCSSSSCCNEATVGTKKNPASIGYEVEVVATVVAVVGAGVDASVCAVVASVSALEYVCDSDVARVKRDKTFAVRYAPNCRSQSIGTPRTCNSSSLSDRRSQTTFLCVSNHHRGSGHKQTRNSSCRSSRHAPTANGPRTTNSETLNRDAPGVSTSSGAIAIDDESAHSAPPRSRTASSAVAISVALITPLHRHRRCVENERVKRDGCDSIDDTRLSWRRRRALS